MSDFTIACDDEPEEPQLDELRRRLRDYNAGFVGPAGFRRFLLSVRDGRGDLIGGLEAEVAWTWLHVSYLWVREDRRMTGVGAALLQAAERKALDAGCAQSDLDTFEFQARGFYERQGYSVFAVQEDYPPGSRRYFLRKALI